MNVIQGGEWAVDASDEVRKWRDSLGPKAAARLAKYVQLLLLNGPTLKYPYCSSLGGRLRELRIPIGKMDWRVTYYFTSERRAQLLTVFPKTKDAESGEVERARLAMEAHREGMNNG